VRLTTTDKERRPPLITLAGAPEEIGRTWGEMNAEAIREHYMEFISEAEERGLDDVALLSRAGRATEIIEEIAPHWGAECDAMAEAADLPADLFFVYHLGKYRELLFGVPECTSYAAAGAATAEGRSLFHKSRDNRARWQAAYVKRQQLVGDEVYAFISVSDVSDVGCMMMVNERGLAGSADTGAKDENPFYQGLMNPWILRYLAERAADCNQALAILQQMVEARFYAGGDMATNWMFADAAGNVLRVVNFNHHLEPEMIQDGFLLNSEREGLREFMDEHSGNLDATSFKRASRLASVAQDTTISSLTVEIDPQAPQYNCAWASLGHPEDAPYVPMSLMAERTPRALADGTLYQASLEWEPEPEMLYELEADFALRAAEAEAEGRALSDAGQVDKARGVFEDMTAACVADALEAMSAGR